MNFKDYQEQASKTALYKKETALEYTILGLVNEAGEVADAYKQILKAGQNSQSALNLAKESGDCLWYLSQVVRELGLEIDVELSALTEKYADSVNDETSLQIAILSLVFESGEVAGIYKKVLRGDKSLDDSNKAKILNRCNDVLWSLYLIVKWVGYDLNTIAEMNIAKLNDRLNRGVIKGDGDNR